MSPLGQRCTDPSDRKSWNGTMRSVSVAMATYNGARHIQQQLDSLAAQSYLPAELVISDDRSEDDTLAIIQDFAESAPFPVALHVNSDRLGYRRNFMKAAGLSRAVVCTRVGSTTPTRS